jgi:DNA-binding HxlR family transcriptional regulator
MALDPGRRIQAEVLLVALSAGGAARIVCFEIQGSADRRKPPLPGRPVRGSRTGRPVMALLDLLGRRWTLRVLWELREHPAPTFRDLQERCGQVSSSVLTERLRELRQAGIVARSDEGYGLTKEGVDLLQALKPVDRWAARWGRRQPRT